MTEKKRKRRRPISKDDPVKREPAAALPSFKDHLLAIPQDGGEFERMKIRFREVDFEKP